MLDADVYGPSLPKLLGISGRPRAPEGSEKKMLPMENYGLKVMSMGFLVDEGTPVIWRGPMVMSALMQMLRDTAWGDVDVMVIDMPPGTGDAQLTIAQQTPLAGGVIVSTPQDLALIDARKGLGMFRKVNVPVLGIIENMSYFVCTKCGERHEIFGHGGARDEAQRLGVPFLGAVPLDTNLRVRSDAGEPVVATEPNGELAETYREIANRVWMAIAEPGRMKPAPRIVIGD
jgi:ATP-binding protein involved in chromosome partitioning